MKQLILASASPGRKRLLEETGIAFTVDVSDYEEDMSLDLSPKDLAIFLSKGKAESVAKRHKNAVILAADSMVAIDGQVFGKPHTPERAKEMLTRLSGRSHLYITGITIIDADSGKMISDSAQTIIHFKNLTEKEIENYVSKGDALEKAGGYGVHGLGGIFVTKIEGECSNITGLPMCLVSEKLKDFGIYFV